MENNLDCSLVFHLANCIDSKNNIINVHGPKISKDHSFFSIKDAILSSDILVPTNSMLFKTKYSKMLPDWAKRSPVGDIPLTLILAHNERIGFLNDIMSNYRVLSSNSWSKEMTTNSAKRKIHDQKIKIMWIEFNLWSNFAYSKLIRKVLILNNYRILKRELKIKCSSFLNSIKKY